MKRGKETHCFCKPFIFSLTTKFIEVVGIDVLWDSLEVIGAEIF